MSVPANAIQGGLAFNAALGDARNFVNETFARYGWQMPTATGSYTSAAAGEAFDPNLTLSFDPNTGAMTSKMPTQATGQYGTTGLFAETAQAGASGEADVTSELRSRGIMTGGLAGQRRQLAETMASRQMGEVSSELFGGIGGAYSNVGQSYLDYLIGKTTGEQTGASAGAEVAPVTGGVVPPVVPPPVVVPPTPVTTGTPAGMEGVKPGTPQIEPATNRGNYNKKGSPGGNVPGNPAPGQIFVGAQGVKWVYRTQGPNGSGWYKKG